MVLATQNPIEQEGTTSCQAQVLADRFMLKTVIDYPKMEDERYVIRQNLKGSYEKVNPVSLCRTNFACTRSRSLSVYMDEKIEKYILDIIFATRYPEI